MVAYVVTFALLLFYLCHGYTRTFTPFYRLPLLPFTRTLPLPLHTFGCVADYHAFTFLYVCTFLRYHHTTVWLRWIYRLVGLPFYPLPFAVVPRCYMRICVAIYVTLRAVDYRCRLRWLSLPFTFLLRSPPFAALPHVVAAPHRTVRCHLPHAAVATCVLRLPVLLPLRSFYRYLYRTVATFMPVAVTTFPTHVRSALVIVIYRSFCTSLSFAALPPIVHLLSLHLSLP